MASSPFHGHTSFLSPRQTSSTAVPLAFRSVFEHVRESVEERFPIRAEDLAVVIAGGLNQSLDETEENYFHSAETFALMQNARGEVRDTAGGKGVVTCAIGGVELPR